METNNQRVSIKSKSQSSSQPDQKTSDVFYVAVKIKNKKLGAKTTPESRRLFTVHYCTNANKNMTPKIVTVWRLLLLLFLLLAHSATVRNHVQHLFSLSLSLSCRFASSPVKPQSSSRFSKATGAPAGSNFPHSSPSMFSQSSPNYLTRVQNRIGKTTWTSNITGTKPTEGRNKILLFFFSPFGCGRRQFNKRGGEITGAFPMTN